jgi:peptidoglycan/LPS O-acetylase OafA/YrhL
LAVRQRQRTAAGLYGDSGALMGGLGGLSRRFPGTGGAEIGISPVVGTLGLLSPPRREQPLRATLQDASRAAGQPRQWSGEDAGYGGGFNLGRQSSTASSAQDWDNSGWQQQLQQEDSGAARQGNLQLQRSLSAGSGTTADPLRPSSLFPAGNSFFFDDENAGPDHLAHISGSLNGYVFPAPPRPQTSFVSRMLGAIGGVFRRSTRAPTGIRAVPNMYQQPSHAAGDGLYERLLRADGQTGGGGGVRGRGQAFRESDAAPVRGASLPGSLQIGSPTRSVVVSSNRKIGNTAPVAGGAGSQAGDKACAANGEVPSPRLNPVFYDPLGRSSLIKSAVKCFSLRFNFPRMMTMWGNSEKDGDLAVLNGIRALSACWIIFGNTGSFMAAVGFTNWNDILPPYGAFSTWAFQMVPSAEFAVDAFLLISAFLSTQALLKLARAQGGLSVTSLLGFLLKRAIRIWPVYGAAIMSYVFLAPLLGKGPFWYLIERLASNCRSHWWTNLLFVSNFVPGSDNFVSECMGWTYFLSLDMQLVLVVPLLVLAYLSSVMIGSVVTALVFFGGLGAGVWIVLENNLSSILEITTTPSNAYMDFYFTKPWTRAPPYVIGVALSFAWDIVVRRRERWEQQQMKNAAVAAANESAAGVGTGSIGSIGWRRFVVRVGRPFRWTRRAQAAVQLFGAAMVLLVVFGTVAAYKTVSNPWPAGLTTAYTILSRSIFTFGLSLVIFVCLTHRRNIVARLCAAPGWEFISRLSFAAYLLHPVVMQVCYFQVTQYFRYSPVMYASWFCSNWLLSLVAASVFFLLIENPCANLAKLLFSWSSEKLEVRQQRSEASKGWCNCLSCCRCRRAASPVHRGLDLPHFSILGK